MTIRLHVVFLLLLFGYGNALSQPCDPASNYAIIHPTCCSPNSSSIISATIITDYAWSDLTFQWQYASSGNNFNDITSADFTGVNTDTLHVIYCVSYAFFAGFRLKITTPDCYFFSNIVDIPPSVNCTDTDNDGYYVGILNPSSAFDPDDNNPCVPDQCSPMCDFDGDGIVNLDDPDDDNDGLLDINDPNNCYICTSNPCAPQCDFDLDGIPNDDDSDDDNDGCPDITDPNDCDPTDNLIEIQSSSLCPATFGDCEQVCEHSTVTYSVENPDNLPIIWKVSGTEDYNVQGNQVVVNWGEEGNGQVEVIAVRPCDHFYINCGQVEPATPGVSGYYRHSVIRGCPGQPILCLSSSGWSTYNGGLNYGTNNSDNIITSNYVASAFSSNGTPYKLPYNDAIKYCSYDVTAAGEPNIYIELTELKQPINCSDCSGRILYQIYSELPIATVNYQNTVTGEILNDVDNLCPGTYTITATDTSGFSKTEEVIISCGDPNTCSNSNSLCVSILPRPKALFTTEPPATNGILNLCKGETVLFTNTSEDAPQNEWSFGDGATSAIDNPVHNFSTPGSYEVQLITRSGCVCSDTSKLTVIVSDAEIPDIQCIGPICLGDTATYRTNVTCGNFDWVISPNGSIFGGGGATDNFVTVKWNSGNSGSIQLTATSCASNICDKPVREVVNILGGPVTIEGPGIVCQNTTAEYSIPNFQGSDITWSITGTGALIAEGQNTNKITVQWGNFGGTVSVDYNNCFLLCGGSGQKQVAAKPPSIIDGLIEVCMGDAPFYKHKSLDSNDLINSTWQILDANGSVVWSASNTPGQINPTWDFPPGQYTIQAIPNGGLGSCNSESGLSVTVFGPPPMPGISGTTAICPTFIYTYTAQTSVSNAEFHWTIKNGSDVTTKTGNSVTVKWGTAPPYALTLVQIDKGGPGCESAPFTLEVNPIPALTISGPDYLCKETSASYTTQQVQDIDYQWSVEPATAGGILSGQGTPTVEVFWQTPGLHSLKLFACGSASSFQVEITAPVGPEIVHPDSLCPGEVTSVSAIGSFASFVWKNENGGTVSTSSTVNLGPGHYFLEATDATGCVSSNTFFMAPLSSPEAEIKAQILDLCIVNPITLFALESPNGYQFQWLRNGLPVGTNASTLDATLPGIYSVQVTGQNGCIAVSEPIVLTDCNTGGGGGGSGGPPTPPGGGQICQPANNPFFTTSPLGSCDSIQFMNLSQNMVPNTQLWQVYDPITGDFYQNMSNEPTFVFDAVGFYLIQLWGEMPDANDPNGPGCYTHYEEFVRIPLVAKFSVIESCPGQATRFTDLSNYLPETSITAWSWNFGDPGSGTSNTSTEQHPTHVFGQTGSYTVTLTVTSSTGCDASFAMDVTVHGPPSVSFDPPSAICAASALSFSATGSNDIISYNWDFGDPASGNGNFSQNQSTWHTYPDAGNYNVSMTVANIYGCTASYTASVSIVANNFFGDITPAGLAPICEGESANLTAPSGGTTWLWSNGATTSSISASTGGIYAVTVTDVAGCAYKPEPVILEVIPGPVASIRAVELNELGQPVAYHPNGYTGCEGEDVYLEMVGEPKYAYQWSDGSTGEILNFTEANGDLLPVGQHVYTVTVTDTETGCMAVVGPFPVTINGAPVGVAIYSNPVGPLCDGTEAVFNVVNPQPGISYLWNTGDAGPVMAAAAAGSYLVQATNQFGCKANSSPIEIHNSAPIGNAPSGCYTYCLLSEICLPQMPEVAAYQWFLNGTTIPAPDGTVPNLVATESGDYTVQMTSIHGCVGISDPLSLTLEPPMSDISGIVWLDSNNNGIIDAGDTPLPGIGVLLAQNGTATDTLSSGSLGDFVFSEFASGTYQIQLDTANLPIQFSPIIWNMEAQLMNCHDSTGVQFLVKDQCFLPIFNTVQFDVCHGDSIDYNGASIHAGDTQQFVFQSFFGCDSTVTVMANELPTSSGYVTLVGCQGEPVLYDGQTLMPGDTAMFTYANWLGCDSMVQVAVLAYPSNPPTELTMAVCPGDSLVYKGETLWPGDVQQFIFQDQNGCDSLVNVSVSAYPEIEFGLMTEDICPGTSDGFVEVNIATGDGPFSAAIGSGGFAQTQFFDGLSAGQHTIKVRDTHGCIASQGIDIQELPQLAIATEDYILPCDEPSVILHPIVLTHSGQVHWLWEDGSSKDWLQAKQEGSYLVKISDDCSTEELAILVEWGDNLPTEPFYIPNAFSPNNDGINDEFRAYLAEGVHLDEFQMFVFDRWGNQLFETKDPAIGWNGIFRDKLMDAGVVVWYVIAKATVCGRQQDVFQEGSLTIMR